MDMFEELFGNELTDDAEDRRGSKGVIDMMVMMANTAFEEGNYEEAFHGYLEVLKLEPNDVAQYNLGSMYAQGKGVKQDFIEGAYWFHQAELSGDEHAGLLCLKCALDFVHQNFKKKSPEQLFTDMVRFVKRVYPDAIDTNREVCSKLSDIAENHSDKDEFAAAAKLLRAAAEFGHDGYSQLSLALQYTEGEGVEENGLASLYWLDKAVDNGPIEIAFLAKETRDEVLNTFKSRISATEFYDEMMKLSGLCSVGSKDVPKDAAKAAYWREIGEKAVKKASRKKGD